MATKIVVGGIILNVISAYVPQTGLDEEVKRHFWKGLDEEQRRYLTEFARAFELINANSSFLKREEHLVTFLSTVANINIDYLLLKREVLEKAYDMVSVAYIRVIKDMYDGAKTRGRTVGGDSEHFPVVIGLHQGSVLSPFLFALAIDALTRHIQGEVPWCKLFADDIVLIDET
nr:uncharacterized protein LOC104092045 [Nicotiana tomentosiformis]